MNYLLAIDQGTTGTKVLVMDTDLKEIAAAYHPFEQHFPKPGWVEHDLDQIWHSVVAGIQDVCQKIDAKKIIAIGVTNQRETTGFWERGSARPLGRAIVWQDRRTADFCQQLKDKGAETYFQEATGLLLDPYFSGSKIRWALDNWGEVKLAHREGTLAVGTMDSYLVARLSGGTAHVTEPSNASRTLCFHLRSHEWDAALCQALGVPNDIWPSIFPSTGKFAQTRGVPSLPDGIPVTGILGDQQSALMGQTCFEEGTAKCTYGTGAFLLLNIGKKPIVSRHKLLTTVAWALDKSNYTYALEGSAFIAGAAIQWLRDGLGIIRESSEIETLAEQVPSSDGVTFVPALTGLGAPYWNPHATGMLTGLTRGTSRAHIARAALEGVAFQNSDILLAMQKDLGKPFTRLSVDGGACRNDLLMQFQADILGIPLIRPKMTETTSLGAIFAAGLGAGVWNSFEEIRTQWKQDRVFQPRLQAQERELCLRRWKDAVARVNLKC